MAATPAWLAPVEALLNRGVHASTQATALAHRLGGTALRLNVEGMASIRISVVRGRLSLVGAGSARDSPALDSGSEPADATIAGSPLALLRFAGATGGRGASREPARSAGAVVSGDAEIAISYRELLALARPDFEEELSRLIGDVPARRLSQFALRTVEWARRARRAAGENLAEYLQEESRDLVNKPELDEFLEGVDTLRETADRVEARIARLEQRMKDSA
jgi:ubiquinone biosynthesis protein UbiJ